MTRASFYFLILFYVLILIMSLYQSIHDFGVVDHLSFCLMDSALGDDTHVTSSGNYMLTVDLHEVLFRVRVFFLFLD